MFCRYGILVAVYLINIGACLAVMGVSTRPVWPNSGFNTYRNGNSPYNGPAGPEVQSKWVVPLVGTVGSGFVLSSDNLLIYGTSSRLLVAINVTSGALRWSVNVAGDVLATPALSADGLVFIGSKNGSFVCLDVASGASHWSYVSPTNGFFLSSPVVDSRGVVYVGSDDKFVHAFNSTTGTLLWSVITGGKVQSSPAVSDTTVFVGSFDKKLYALDAVTGTVKWTFSSLGRISASPCLSSNRSLVFMGSEDGVLHAINASSGSVMWGYTMTDPVTVTPAVSENDVLYLGAGDFSFQALDGWTGSVVWRSTAARDGFVSAAVLSANDIVFCGCLDRRVYAWNASTGVLLWSFDTGGAVRSSVVLGDTQTLYVASDSLQLFALASPTPSPSVSVSPSTSPSTSDSSSLSESRSASASVSLSASVTASASWSQSVSLSSSPSPSQSNSVSSSETPSTSPSTSRSGSVSITSSISQSASITVSRTRTPSKFASIAVTKPLVLSPPVYTRLVKDPSAYIIVTLTISSPTQYSPPVWRCVNIALPDTSCNSPVITSSTVSYNLTIGSYNITGTASHLSTATIVAATVPVVVALVVPTLGISVGDDGTCFAGRSCSVSVTSYGFPPVPLLTTVKVIDGVTAITLTNSTPSLLGRTLTFTWFPEADFKFVSKSLSMQATSAVNLPGIDAGSEVSQVWSHSGVPFSINFPYQWNVFTNDGCSSKCGSGNATRSITCVDRQALRIVDDSVCLGFQSRPAVLEACLNLTCAQNATVTVVASVGDWGVCSSSCGPGTQTRNVACVTRANVLVDDSVCLSNNVTLPASSRSCDAGPCDTYSLVVGPREECNAVCDGGFYSQVSYCTSTLRHATAQLSACAAFTNVSLTLFAQGGMLTSSCGSSTICPALYRWVTDDLSWSPCSATCGLGVSTRPLRCVFRHDGRVSTNPAVDCANSEDPPVSSRQCMIRPCVSHASHVSEWDELECTSCDGMKYRSLSCVSRKWDSGTTQAVNVSHCLGSTALSLYGERLSERCGQCAFCNTTDCSGHGSCDSTRQVCLCDTGYSGLFCQRSDACTGPLNARGHCCPAGSVLDANFECCTPVSGSVNGRLLAADGSCCPTGQVNKCGVCNGLAMAVLSATGQCCVNGIVDASGVCCSSGYVDVFGVCNGLHASGAQTVQLTLQLNTTVIVANLSQPLSPSRLWLDDAVARMFGQAMNRSVSTIQVLSYRNVTSRRLSTGIRITRLSVHVELRPYGGMNRVSTPILLQYLTSTSLFPVVGYNFTVLSIQSVAWRGVCGNAVCETGERPDPGRGESGCPIDCTYPALDCPVTRWGQCNGAGICVLSASQDRGECACWSSMGYAGPSCSECGVGFTMSASGHCVQLEVPAYARILSSPSPFPIPNSNNMTLILMLVIIVPTGVCGCFGLYAILRIFWLKRRVVVKTPDWFPDAMVTVMETLDEQKRHRLADKTPVSQSPIPSKPSQRYSSLQPSYFSRQAAKARQEAPSGRQFDDDGDDYVMKPNVWQDETKELEAKARPASAQRTRSSQQLLSSSNSQRKRPASATPSRRRIAPDVHDAQHVATSPVPFNPSIPLSPPTSPYVPVFPQDDPHVVATRTKELQLKLDVLEEGIERTYWGQPRTPEPLVGSTADRALKRPQSASNVRPSSAVSRNTTRALKSPERPSSAKPDRTVVSPQQATSPAKVSTPSRLPPITPGSGAGVHSKTISPAPLPVSRKLHTTASSPTLSRKHSRRATSRTRPV